MQAIHRKFFQWMQDFTVPDTVPLIFLNTKVSLRIYSMQLCRNPCNNHAFDDSNHVHFMEDLQE